MTEFRFDSINGRDTLEGDVNALIFGNEGEDDFQILNALTATDQFLVMSDLAARESLGQSDFENNEDSVSFVERVNRPPVVLPIPDQTTTVNQLYVFNVLAFDPNFGDVLTYSLRQFPSGMEINETTGLITWNTPTDTDIGSHPVTVRVTDSGGLFDEQSYTLTVEAS